MNNDGDGGITIEHVLWGSPLPAGARATRVPKSAAAPAMPLAWIVAQSPGVSIVPAAIVVHLTAPPPPTADESLAAVASALAELAVARRVSVRNFWTFLRRMHRDRTLVDVGALVSDNSDYRRVLHTEVLGAPDGSGTQCVAMTLRPRDAINDADGAVVPRERHSERAQILVAVHGTGGARATVELVELKRRVTLTPPGSSGGGTFIMRIPPGITHIITLETADDNDAGELKLLSIYTSAEHADGLVQPERMLVV